ncbi:unnamed protein product [Effrenium voratum]|nr:unnamed protein product [Effrenium voratum]
MRLPQGLSRRGALAAATAAPQWGVNGTMAAAELERAASVLNTLQKQVLFEGATEDPQSGRTVNGYPWDSKERGIYVSAISGAPLFSSDGKLKEEPGWPSFHQPLVEANLLLRPDPRDQERLPPEMWSTEVLDKASMTHLGHILDDGDGRSHYCINAAALRFIPSH